MRAILIITLLIGAFGFVGWRVYRMMASTAQQAEKAATHTPAALIAAYTPLPEKPHESENQPPPVILLTYEEARDDPLRQQTYYELSAGRLAGIAMKRGVATAWTTDGRTIAHAQIQAIGRDWVLLRTGSYLRYGSPRERPPPPLQPSQTPTVKTDIPEPEQPVPEPMPSPPEPPQPEPKRVYKFGRR